MSSQNSNSDLINSGLYRDFLNGVAVWDSNTREYTYDSVGTYTGFE